MKTEGKNDLQCTQVIKQITQGNCYYKMVWLTCRKYCTVLKEDAVANGIDLHASFHPLKTIITVMSEAKP